MKQTRELLIAFANALESASALARRIAESESTSIEITDDSEALSPVIYKHILDNFAESDKKIAVDWDYLTHRPMDTRGTT